MAKKLSKKEDQQKRDHEEVELRSERQKLTEYLKENYVSDDKSDKEVHEIFGLEEFVAEGLEKFDDEQLKVPKGKYKDVESISAKYRQTFIKYIQELCPEVIEELREYALLFDSLFSKERDDYLNVFHGLKDNLVSDYFPLSEHIDFLKNDYHFDSDIVGEGMRFFFKFFPLM